MRRNIMLMVLGGAMFFGSAFSAHAASLTPTQINAVLTLLQSFNVPSSLVANVEANLKGSPVPFANTALATANSAVCPYTWTVSRTIGATGEDILKLQQFLNQTQSTKVQLSGAGSPGRESWYFGHGVQNAVAAFQLAHGITPAVGFFGEGTRAAINRLCASATSVVPTTTVDSPITHSSGGGGGGGSSGSSSNPDNPTPPTPTPPSTITGVELLAPVADEALHAGSSYTLRWQAGSDAVAVSPIVDLVLVGMTSGACDPYGCGRADPTGIFAQNLTGAVALAAADSKLTIASGISLSAETFAWNIPANIASQVSAYQNTYKIYFLKTGTNEIIFPYTDITFTIQ